MVFHFFQRQPRSENRRDHARAWSFRPRVETLEMRDLPSAVAPALRPGADRPADMRTSTADNGAARPGADRSTPARQNAGTDSGSRTAVFNPRAFAATDSGQNTTATINTGAAASGATAQPGRPAEMPNAAMTGMMMGEQRSPMLNAQVIQGIGLSAPLLTVPMKPSGQTDSLPTSNLDPLAAAVGRAFMMSDDDGDRMFKLALESPALPSMLDDPTVALFGIPPAEPTTAATELLPVTDAAPDAVAVLLDATPPTVPPPPAPAPEPLTRLLEESLPFAAELPVRPLLVQRSESEPADAAEDGSAGEGGSSGEGE